MSLINSICPFEKQEVICKICEGTDGAMESIFCERDDHRLLNKIFKSTDVKVEPVCGILSPICEFCRTRIDQFDDNFQPRCKEYVVERIVSSAPDDDPFNCLDPCAVEQQPQQQELVEGSEDDVAEVEEAKVEPIKIEKFTRDVRIAAIDEKKIKDEELEDLVVMVEIEDKSKLSGEEDCQSTNGNLGHESDAPNEEEQDTENSVTVEPLRKKKRRGRPRVEFPLSGIKTPTKCEICNKMVVYMKDHMRIHSEEKQFKCPHCDRTFSQSNNLIYHVRKHTGEKPFACDKCNKSFICKSHLLSHSRTHVNDQPFQCEICSRRFNQACNLTKHLRVHSGEKPYSCRVCAKAFMNLSNMKAHEKRHRGERNFTCEICSKSFYDNHHLERHMSIHSKEKRFKCVRCPKQFTTLEDLKEHATRHKDPMEVNSCNICCRTFSSVHKLNLHLKSHDPSPPEDQPMQCETCFKPFKRQEQLELHQQRVHGGDLKPKKPSRATIIDPETAAKQLEGPFRKPYLCEVCSREFNQAYNLKVHLKTHMLDEKLHACEKCQRLFRRRDHLEAHQRKAECLSTPTGDDAAMVEAKLKAEPANNDKSLPIDLPPQVDHDRQQIVIKYEIQNV